MSNYSLHVSEREKRRLAAPMDPLLFVDDSRTVLKIRAEMLANMGIAEVVEASPAEAAFRRMRQVDVKWVICDMVMEGVSEWQQNILRTTGQTRQIPF